MKTSRFVEQVETVYDCALVVQAGRLHVLTDAPLPPHVRLGLAGHRDELVGWLAHRTDADLRIIRAHAELTHLGIVQLENGDWTHPDGDHVMDELIAGLLNPDDALAATTARDKRARQEAHALGVSAPRDVFGRDLEDISLKPGRHPGHSTFCIERGKRYRKLPHE